MPVKQLLNSLEQNYSNIESKNDYNHHNINPTGNLKYKKLTNLLDMFLELCEEDNILARRNWTCCNTCGNYEIELEKKTMEEENDKKYVGYIFYHLQEKESIYDQCKNNDENIKIHLNWGYFYSDDYDKDPYGIALGNKIKKIAEINTDNSIVELEFTDFNKKLLLKININY